MSSARQAGNTARRDLVRSRSRGVGWRGGRLFRLGRLLSAASLLGPYVRPTCAVVAGTPEFWTKYGSCKWRRQPWS